MPCSDRVEVWECKDPFGFGETKVPPHGGAFYLSYVERLSGGDPFPPTTSFAMAALRIRSVCSFKAILSLQRTGSNSSEPRAVMVLAQSSRIRSSKRLSMKWLPEIPNVRGSGRMFDTVHTVGRTSGEYRAFPVCVARPMRADGHVKMTS
jgi:hypothetical protein